MNPKDAVISHLLAHLNGQLTEAELIAWAEGFFVELSERDDEFELESTLLDVLGYIGAGDTPGFPLSFGVLSGFLDQLGVRIRVVAEAG